MSGMTTCKRCGKICEATEDCNGGSSGPSWCRDCDKIMTTKFLNKVYNKNFELSLDDIEDTSGVPVMAVIPHDVNVPKAQSEFIPLIDHSPNSEASEEYKKLAASLIGEQYKPPKMKRFFRWLDPRKQDVNRAVYYKRAFKD